MPADPVFGMEASERSKWKAEYNDVVYYFCCEDCLRGFQKDPERYVSGDLVLLKNDLRDVVASIQFSKRTLKQIKENLIWAFLYNIILIPVVVMGLLYPVYAGFAMAMSSVSVMSWSLLMRKYIPEVHRSDS
ncbi:MAG: YHS domain-containing protein [Thermoprotei archaeon]